MTFFFLFPPSSLPSVCTARPAKPPPPRVHIHSPVLLAPDHCVLKFEVQRSSTSSSSANRSLPGHSTAIRSFVHPLIKENNQKRNCPSPRKPLPLPAAMPNQKKWRNPAAAGTRKKVSPPFPPSSPSSPSSPPPPSAPPPTRYSRRNFLARFENAGLERRKGGREEGREGEMEGGREGKGEGKGEGGREHQQPAAIIS